MEIKNCTTPNYSQSFGMALIKPKPEQMESFIDYITAHGKIKLKFVKRGLRQIQRENANNKFFDISYVEDWRNGQAFKIDPKFNSGVSSPLLRGKLYDRSTVYPNRLQRTIEELNSKNPKSGLETGYILMKYLCKLFGDTVYLLFNPKEVLPASLRMASDEAINLAKQIEKSENKRKITLASIVETFDK